MKRREIILAVVSKNEHANAVLPFREHPHMVLKEEDISVFVANWDNKADNIRLVQKTLNIGFDSLVFLDDNPFERNIVREFLPEVVARNCPRTRRSISRLWRVSTCSRPRPSPKRTSSGPTSTGRKPSAS